MLGESTTCQIKVIKQHYQYLISVIHGQTHATTTNKIVHFIFYCLTVFGGVAQFQFAVSWDHNVD